MLGRAGPAVGEEGDSCVPAQVGEGMGARQAGSLRETDGGGAARPLRDSQGPG